MMASLDMARGYARLSEVEERAAAVAGGAHRPPRAPRARPTWRPASRPGRRIWASCCRTRRCITCSCARAASRSWRPAAIVPTSPSRSTTTRRARGWAALRTCSSVHDRPIARPCDDSVVRVSRGRENVLRRARGLRAAARARGPRAAANSGRRRTSQEHRRDRRGPRCLRQPARRRSRDGRGAAGVRARHRRPVQAVRVRAGARRLRPASRLRLDAVGAAIRAAGGQRAAPSRPRRIVRGRERRSRRHTSASPGTAPATARTASIWGGEFFLVDGSRIRAGRAPAAVPAPGWRGRDPRGPARRLRPQFEVAGAEGLEPIVGRMLERGVNSPLTTSVGRFFDAVAAITGVAPAERLRGPGRTAMEHAIGLTVTDDAYSIAGGDWAPMLRELEKDSAGAGVGEVPQWPRRVDLEVARAAGVAQVVLSGGSSRIGIWSIARRPASRRMGLPCTRISACRPTTGGSPSARPCWRDWVTGMCLAVPGKVVSLAERRRDAAIRHRELRWRAEGRLPRVHAGGEAWRLRAGPCRLRHHVIDEAEAHSRRLAYLAEVEPEELA